MLVMLSVLLAAHTIWAGGSGLNVVVVVNQNSTNSVQLGNDYCELRSVPPQNVLRITNWTGGSVNWSPSDFQNQLLNPLLALLASRSLTQQVQYVVLSMDIPYRVQDGTGQNSTTAALFYGFKTNGPPVSGIASCSLPDNTSNSYAYSESTFFLARPNTATTNAFLAMMLTDTDFISAEKILRRGVAADATSPTQAVYLAKTSDWARNVRFTEFDNAVFENQVAGNFAVSRTNTDSTTFTNLFGLQTGLYGYGLNPNTFIPGSLADTLTSFGGFILENSGQTPVLAFLDAGASGTYGTIVEPCNYTQKFPDPVDYFYQTRGFSLAEAYYQSVLNPFQGLFVGEPLAAPFVRYGTANWTSLTNGTMLGGTVTLGPIFAAAATNLPVAAVDLFVDGTYFQTLTNLTPSAGNVVSVVINGFTVNYTVPANATVASVAAGLSAALNLQSASTHVLTGNFGDRIELQSLPVYTPGGNVTLTAGAAIGSAAALTTSITTARPAFLDTVATGYQFVTFYNAPNMGDWIQVTVTKTNGTSITLGVTNTVSGTTIGAMSQNLLNLINGSASLQSTDGLYGADFFDYDPYGSAAAQFFLYARTSGFPAAQILTYFHVTTNLFVTPAGMNPMADNVCDLRPRNHLYIAAGTNALTVNYPFDTTQVADGYHQLTAVAYDGSSVAAQTAVSRTVLLQNNSLTATLSSLPSGTNAALSQQLQFTVTASTTNISRIELFSTGGSLGFATNQATANFSPSSSYLGLGLHPFYAVVTDQSGHVYQTSNFWYRIIPDLRLSLARSPSVLTWATAPFHAYDLQYSTNLTVPFQTITTITAADWIVQWPVSRTNSAAFYRVQFDR